MPRADDYLSKPDPLLDGTDEPSRSQQPIRSVDYGDDLDVPDFLR